ncbi:MAG: glycosyl transferase family 28 [Actinomycetia bacterium]|nr:glycosyl transferase family 28 [Actinomycetes bacterium]
MASSGGHLSEMHHLAPRLSGLSEAIWVTPDTPQSRSLLRDQLVEHIPVVESRELAGALRLIPTARRLVSELQPSMIISTGAAPAVPFLAVAAAAQIPAHYVESLTRVDQPSLSGRILQFLPRIDCYSQYNRFSTRRWHHIGSLFDDYLAQPTDHRQPIRKVVVTVGTMRKYGFRSLIERVLSILPDGVDVIWQTGETIVSDLPIEGRRLIPADELARAMAEADVVIGHAGCGTAIDALEAGRLPILVPRRAARGEHVDDHQAQMAAMLANMGLAFSREVDQLGLDDLEMAASRQVEHVPDPQTLTLVGA